MNTIGDCIARLRGSIKAVKEDAFITDRFLYSLAWKYSKALIKREDERRKVTRYGYLFKTIPCVELIETDYVEACCINIKTGCTIKRTKEKLPKIVQGVNGPLIRLVSSIDKSQIVYETTPGNYIELQKSSSFKYNKNLYYWIIDDYMYFPNMIWEAVAIEAIWDEDISNYVCSSEDKCKLRQEQPFSLPEYLFAEVEKMVIQDLTLRIQIPPDNSDDKQNVQR